MQGHGQYNIVGLGTFIGSFKDCKAYGQGQVRFLDGDTKDLNEIQTGANLQEIHTLVKQACLETYPISEINNEIFALI